SACCSGSSRMNPPVPPSRHSTPAGSGSFSSARTTWTPTPSSPMMTLPSPSTSVFCPDSTTVSDHRSLTTDHRFLGPLCPAGVRGERLAGAAWSLGPCLLVPCFSVELPSADDRRDRATALDVIVIEGEINVNDDECDKEPEQQMMPKAHSELAAHQRHNPLEHPRQPRIAHAGVKRKSRDGLEAKGQEGAEVDQTCKRVVPRGDGAVHLGFEHVGLDNVDNLLLLRALEREKGGPPGVLVADESPVNARRKVKDVDVSRREVQEAHPAEPVLLIRLGCVSNANRVPDQEAGHAEQGQRDRVDPVIRANRKLPHVHAPVLDRRAAVGPKNVSDTGALCAHAATRRKSG